MKNNFVSVLRQPDTDFGATEATPMRFEEAMTKCNDVKYDYVVKDGVARVTVYPSGSPVKYLKLRFRGDLSFVDKVYGDTWERSGGDGTLEWHSVSRQRLMPWFCYLRGEGRTMCYGVKTGADSFAGWIVDTHGITLFINLTNGCGGTDLREPIVACELVELCGEEGEDSYRVAKRFSRMLCDKPKLPREPIFGVNNWYWAYGKISRESVMHETDYLMKMCEGTSHRPYMIIDDGWQLCRTYDEGAYIGGPWLPNDRFGDMREVADAIHKKGAKAGIWFRPLLTLGDVPEDAKLEKFSLQGGVILDPSHPYTLERVKNDARTLRDWGFDLIKHDFTTMDLCGHGALTAHRCAYEIFKKTMPLYDKTRTNATILKDLYKAIQDGAGDADVIACNAVGHLAAGIHSIYRTGNDTSGRSVEWTLRYGLNTVMRLPLNDALYRSDPDCAAFTDTVDPTLNLDFLEMCALTGMTTLASVTPDILSCADMRRINKIFRMADEDTQRFGIKNYDKTSDPYLFASEDGKEVREFDWNRAYDGTRVVLTWKI